MREPILISNQLTAQAQCVFSHMLKVKSCVRVDEGIPVLPFAF